MTQARFSTPEVEGAIARSAATKRILREGPVLELLFDSATNRRDVEHRLGVIPDGYIVVLESLGGHVTAVDVSEWDDTIAYLMADTAGMRARLYFVETEIPINA